MLLHNTITGVIAAVMVALGAGQIGNTSTQVGEELVVEKNITNKKVNNPVYYGWDMTSNPSNPVYRRIDEPLDINGKCDHGDNDCVLESPTDHGETITDAEADNFGLTPAQGSSPTGQYLF